MIEEVNDRMEITCKVVLLPTFLGCPALEIIKKNTLNASERMSVVGDVEVEFVFNPPWTSDRIRNEVM